MLHKFYFTDKIVDYPLVLDSYDSYAPDIIKKRTYNLTAILRDGVNYILEPGDGMSKIVTEMNEPTLKLSKGFRRHDYQDYIRTGYKESVIPALRVFAPLYRTKESLINNAYLDYFGPSDLFNRLMANYLTSPLEEIIWQDVKAREIPEEELPRFFFLYLMEYNKHAQVWSSDQVREMIEKNSNRINLNSIKYFGSMYSITGRPKYKTTLNILISNIIVRSSQLNEFPFAQLEVYLMYPESIKEVIYNLLYIRHKLYPQLSTKNIHGWTTDYKPRNQFTAFDEYPMTFNQLFKHICADNPLLLESN